MGSQTPVHPNDHVNKSQVQISLSAYLSLLLSFFDSTHSFYIIDHIISLSLLYHLTSPCLISSHHTSPYLTHLISSHFTSTHLSYFISPHLPSSLLSSPHLTSPHLTSHYLTSPHLTSPHLTSPHLTSHSPQTTYFPSQCTSLLL
jgi:hypothetical protein